MVCTLREELEKQKGENIGINLLIILLPMSLVIKVLNKIE